MCPDSTTRDECQWGPWNPGIGSELPRELLPLSTMFRPENVATGLERAQELSDFCGLPPHALVAFRAERLVVHELLVRVTADLSVPDGPEDQDLGINFRAMAARILERYIAPHSAHLAALLDEVRDKATALVERELSETVFRDDPGPAPRPGRPARPSLLSFFGLGRAKAAPAPAAGGDREREALATWRRALEASDGPLERACFDALITVVTAITGRRGRLVGDRALIVDLAVTLVCNAHGSEVIGQAIDPYIREAAAGEGYRLLPRQDKPTVMNVKGASASGKSTVRPLQRHLAARLKLPWDDFAVISPDIWRKFLLDYESLGEAYKYAGTMTGHELEIIDRKLDGYMAKKAAGGRMTHLLIDRFRFDSFAPETEGDETSKLLTRFGHLIYMFFMITPPEATVERAWHRGLKVGRYKAVDDLLDHNVEAYTGMPQLFFTWALRTRKRVHYEFLDNSVAQGRQPRTVAFGWNGEMTVLDIGRLIDIERFRKINLAARRPEEVREAAAMAPDRNTGFLKDCARRIPVINFAEAGSGRVYARLERGQWTYRDEAACARACADDDVRAGLEAIGFGDDSAPGATEAPPHLELEDAHTLGAWGPATSSRS